ncbi:MAG: iron complex outermembrane receptor protein [Parvibaculaceae bacterium]|jgi:iron complex outermembrane receptor protein
MNRVLLGQASLLTLAVALASQPTMAAEPDVVELDPIHVSATRSDTDLSATPGTIEVISGDEITQRLATGISLSDILGRYVAGFAPGNGTISGASQDMRGRNVQFLVNGVPRSSELRGFSRDLALIDPFSIESVEVIKGSNALFGNGATGGLINIVTKGAGKKGTHFTGDIRLSAQDADVGDSLSTDVAVSVAHRGEDFGIRLGAGYTVLGDRFDAKGNLSPSDPLLGQGGGDNFDRYSLNLAADYGQGNHDFELNASLYRLEQDIEHYTDYTTDPVSVDYGSTYTGQNVYDDTKTISLAYTNTSFDFAEIKITPYYSESERRAAYAPVSAANSLVYYSGNPLDPVDPNGQSVLFTEQYGVRLTLNSDLSSVVEGATLTYGSDYGHDNVSQEILDGRDIIAPMEQDSLAFFAQAQVPLGKKFDLSAGIRYEKFFLDVKSFNRPAVYAFAGYVLPAVDVIGTEVDYAATVFNVGAVFHPTEDVDLFAKFSQGFSIPDVGGFTRRAMNANPFDTTPISYANIAPEAQIVDTYEVGARYSKGPLALSGAVFLSTSEEGTTFDAATNEVSQQKEELWGAELNAEYDVSSTLQVGTVLSYTEGRYDSDDDGDIDDWLPNNRIVAPFTATLFADYQFDFGMKLGGDLVYTGQRNKVTGSDVDETITVNMQASYDLGEGTVTAGVNNLFDRSQMNPTASAIRGFPVADYGRSLWVGYSISY